MHICYADSEKLYARPTCRAAGSRRTSTTGYLSCCTLSQVCLKFQDSLSISGWFDASTEETCSRVRYRLVTMALFNERIRQLGGHLVSVRMCPPGPPLLEGLVGFYSLT